ncbi:two-component system chemotaxis response regulator CheB [Azospirillum fermentarium]|uniref:chemotaxis-specific protein-glutamate methyltransferase CheB n=1 Tax=Azospirillum fermentarium TaxID=1233114 RepID=UPI002226EB87|nr:chemotaxis-specific protein-glutamate methyltransferase CheB [Azospirillum fermentarium]MCW2249220.1 two-component system chemotaxis response regulator CheB [Azospirillum fermentarium]
MSTPPRSGLPLAGSPDPLRVLIVDDSAFMRASLRHIVGNTPGFLVVGEAGDGVAAVETVRRLSPDIVTLDIDMPRMNGIEVLREIRPSPGALPAFIMVSAFTTQGAAMTLAALRAGAMDFVPKASEHFQVDLAQVGDLLRAKLAAAATITGRSALPPVPAVAPAPAPPAVPVAARSPAAVPRPAPKLSAPMPVPPLAPVPVKAPAPPAPVAPPPRPRVIDGGPPDIVVVAASTGGPQTLPDLLAPMVPYRAPVVVAQHIPPMFSRSLADTLADLLKVPVVEAADGAELAAGTVYVLPGGHNAEVVRRRPGVLAVKVVDGGGAVYRPNADILFRSAALNARRPVGVVLTGMGNDGCEGARALAQRGCPVLAQDPAAAVIWGMPRAVIDAGLASEVHGAAALGQRLAAMAGKGGGGGLP